MGNKELTRIGVVVDKVLSYYLTRRGVGHTHTMVNGAKDQDCLVLVPNKQIANTIKLRGKCITFGEFEKLEGMQKPLVLDHTAIFEIVASLSKVNSIYEHEIIKLKQELERMKKNEKLSKTTRLFLGIRLWFTGLFGSRDKNAS